MIKVNIRELRRNLSHFIEVAGGEDVEITKHDEPVAYLTRMVNSVHNKEIKPAGVHIDNRGGEGSVHKESPVNCKTCGEKLDPYGMYCLGEGHHRQ